MFIVSDSFLPLIAQILANHAICDVPVFAKLTGEPAAGSTRSLRRFVRCHSARIRNSDWNCSGLHSVATNESKILASNP